MSNRSKGKQQEKIYLSGRLRRLLLKGSREDLQGLRDAGLIDEEALEVLESMKRALGSEYHKTEEAKNIIANQQSKAIQRAVQEGKGDQLAHIVGEERSKADLSSLQLMRKLKRHINTVGRVWQFKGEVNSGKTNLAVIFAELFKEATGGKVLSNMESLKQSETVKSFSKLKDKSEEYERFIFIGEDFSNHASGYSSDLGKVKGKARKWTNELAKLGGNALFLGHTGMDIQKDLRRKAYLVDNPSRKKAIIYEDSKNGKGINKIMALNGIPKASWNYNPDERTSFEWQSKEAKSKDEKIKQQIEEDITQQFKYSSSVKTTELSYNAQKVAEVMRALAKANPDLLNFNEQRSPKELQRKM